MSKYLQTIINKYNYVDKEKGLVFPAPFQEYSLKQLVDLSNRICVNDTNHGHSHIMIVNGEIVEDSYESNYRSLLLYVSFLGRNITEYIKLQSELRKKDLDYKKIYEYVSYLMNGIQNCISKNINNNVKTYPVDIVDYLGKERDSLDVFNHEIDGIIDLMIKQSTNEIDSSVLSDISNKLLKILEVSEEEVESRYDSINETWIINPINIESWLNEKNLTRSKK